MIYITANRGILPIGYDSCCKTHSYTICKKCLWIYMSWDPYSYSSMNFMLLPLNLSPNHLCFFPSKEVLCCLSSINHSKNQILNLQTKKVAWIFFPEMTLTHFPKIKFFKNVIKLIQILRNGFFFQKWRSQTFPNASGFFFQKWR